MKKAECVIYGTIHSGSVRIRCKVESDIKPIRLSPSHTKQELLDADYLRNHFNRRYVNRKSCVVPSITDVRLDGKKLRFSAEFATYSMLPLFQIDLSELLGRID